MISALLIALSIEPQVPTPAGTAPGPGAGPSASQSPIQVRPPFVPSVGTVAGQTLKDGADLPTPYAAGARQFLVNPGQTWQHLVEEIQPGDEVVLAPGFHAPQTIVGLRGDQARPVVVRSRGPVPAAILCAADGLVLRRPSHVVLENILFLKPKSIALTIDGGGGDGAEPVRVDVLVRNVAVQGAALPGQDGIRIVGATDVRVDGCRIDGWGDAALEIRAARRVGVRALMAVPDSRDPAATAISVTEGSSDIAVTGCAINGPVRAGVRIGDGHAGAPCERVRVDRCLLDGPKVGLVFGNVRGVVASRVTFAEPTHAVFMIADGCGGSSGIEIERCLASWAPGGLARFASYPRELQESAVRFGPNVWYSKELPEGWAAIGSPFGIMTGPQTTDIDPDLDPATLRPRNPAIGDFGAYGMTPPPAPPADAVPPAPGEP